MDPKPQKFYHEHVFDSRDYLENYFSTKAETIFWSDCLKFPMVNLHYMFRNGFVAGNLLIDISVGSFIHHLYSASDFFKDIVILKFSEKCVMELQRWLNDRTGAFDWTHASATATQLQGKSEKIQDKEQSLKAAIKNILTCNLEKTNLIDPLVLPLADCLISAWVLDVISKDQDEYVKNLEQLSKLLRIGGHLILLGCINTTYITAGGDKFHVLSYDEAFIRNTLSKLGFVIDYFAVQNRRVVSDFIDYKAITFAVAHKEK